MLKSLGMLTVSMLALVAPAQAVVLGPDAAACSPGSTTPAALVKVEGFRESTGNIRVQVYGGNAAEFLEKGKYVKRVDLPVARSGEMHVCVALPAPGNYAIAVRHDVDGNGRSGWNDGGGFSRNPRLSLTSLKPHYRDVVLPFGPGARSVDVVLNYRQGLAIRPVRTR